MNQTRIPRTVLFSILIAILAGVFLTSAVSAHTALPAPTLTHSQVAASVPNVNIVSQKGKAIFSPTTVHCKARGLKKTCYTLSNKTKVTQTVLFRGKTLVTLRPGQVFAVGSSSRGTFIDRLKSNAQAMLMVIAS